jgi:predicted TIM-barrel fold metal-dependent hydrolase
LDGLSDAHWYAAGEATANRQYNKGLALAKADKNKQLVLADILEHDVLPFWREASDRLSEIDLKPNSPSLARLELLQDIADGRVKGFELFAHGLRENDSKEITEAIKELRELDEMASKRIGNFRQN